LCAQKKIHFFKYQGAGNDFILIEDYHLNFLQSGLLDIPRLCNRHYGIGADGLILLQPSRVSSIQMRIFNPDGGEASMCGNGLRCAIKHLQKEQVSIETAAGICLGKNVKEGVFCSLPIIEDVFSPIALEGGVSAHLINTGVPHLIVEVADLDLKDFEKRARDLRYHPMFSNEGVNVSFIHKRGEDIFIRTYERGVEGETLACGTACAAAVLVVRKSENKKKDKYIVYPKSHNSLSFTFDGQNRIWMRGSAEKVFQGEIQIEKSANR
jgi:diaminopimelate epimerase